MPLGFTFQYYGDAKENMLLVMCSLDVSLQMFSLEKSLTRPLMSCECHTHTYIRNKN